MMDNVLVMSHHYFYFYFTRLIFYGVKQHTKTDLNNQAPNAIRI